MSGRRAPSAPPEIPGFTVIRHLGAGGFADVFLYEQQRPHRQVAIKVLLADMLTPAVRRAFDAEADLMAQLSTHPSIVTIFESGVAVDGRPYLVMEYCPKPNLGERFRKEPFSVADALRIGVEISGAVETAHRARILHRDIKPANVLVTGYDTPALTDFGIASTVEGAEAEAEGMSIPWSPPESFDDPPRSGVGTDVWALAATVYSLLAGRSPFEVRGGANKGADLIARIANSPLPPTGRPDVPASLERVLATGMAKSPESRYTTALAFARALQQVQVELGLPPTREAVLNEDVPLESAPEPARTPPGPAGGDDEPGTRIRSVISIDPSPARTPAATPSRTPAQTSPTRTPAQTSPTRPAEADTVLRGGAPRVAPDPAPDWGSQPAAPPLDSTVLRAEAPPEEEPPVPEDPHRRRWWGWAVAAVLVAATGVAAFALTKGEAPTSASSAATTEAPVVQDVLSGVVEPPEDLTGTLAEGQAVFTWTDPDPVDGNTYLYLVPDEFGEGDYRQAADLRVTVPAAPDGRTCLQVMVRRETGRTSEPVGACVP